MKKFTIIIATLALSGMVKAETKIAFLDMQKAIQSSTQGKKAKSELETEFEKKKKELQKQEADLKKMGEDIEKKKAVLSEEALAKKQAEFQEEMLKYREIVGKSQLEIQKKERELTAPIVEKIKKAVESIAKEKAYTLVLESSQGVLFADKSADITEEVIKSITK